MRPLGNRLMRAPRAPWRLGTLLAGAYDVEKLLSFRSRLVGFSLVRNSVGVAAEVLRHQVSASALEVVMPSVLGLLEVREVAA
ncbi:hypothetical protein QMK19_40670, partial [Streptomyces sp. H10-C2]